MKLKINSKNNIFEYLNFYNRVKVHGVFKSI